MSELSTERLEKFVNDIKTDGMCDITDYQVALALRQLLAYEQAVPVLPKQPETQFDEIALDTAREIMRDVNQRHELIGGECQLLARTQCRINDVLCNVAAPAQPVIPEQAKPVAYTDNRNLKSLQKGCNTALLWLKHNAEVGDIPLYTEVPTQPVSEPYKLPVGYFSYGSECGFDWHNTEKEAIEAAEAVIDNYRGDACDGWSEETDSVCWGVILQQATKVDERPRTDDDKCDPAIDTVCDYALLPAQESE